MSGVRFPMGRENVSAVDDRLERALAAFRDAGDQWGRAAALSTRAKPGYVRGGLKALERDSEQSAELFRGLGDRWVCCRPPPGWAAWTR